MTIKCIYSDHISIVVAYLIIYGSQLTFPLSAIEITKQTSRSFIFHQNNCQLSKWARILKKVCGYIKIYASNNKKRLLYSVLDLWQILEHRKPWSWVLESRKSRMWTIYYVSNNECGEAFQNPCSSLYALCPYIIWMHLLLVCFLFLPCSLPNAYFQKCASSIRVFYCFLIVLCPAVSNRLSFI